MIVYYDGMRNAEMKLNAVKSCGDCRSTAFLNSFALTVEEVGHFCSPSF